MLREDWSLCQLWMSGERGLVIVTLIAIRKGIHMWVVEEGFGAISPRETLSE